MFKFKFQGPVAVVMQDVDVEMGVADEDSV